MPNLKALLDRNPSKERLKSGSRNGGHVPGLARHRSVGGAEAAVGRIAQPDFSNQGLMPNYNQNYERANQIAGSNNKPPMSSRNQYRPLGQDNRGGLRPPSGRAPQLKNL